MIIDFFRELMGKHPVRMEDRVLDAEYEPYREELSLAGLSEEQLRRFLPQAAECGLDGMETLYSKYDAQTTALAERIAAQYGILPSGGSDFHGQNKPGISMGTGRGALCIPAELSENLGKRQNR